MLLSTKAGKILKVGNNLDIINARGLQKESKTFDEEYIK